MEAFWDKLVEFGTTAGLKLIYAVVILVIGMKLVNLLCKKVLKNPKVQAHDASLASFLGNFLSIALKTMVIISAALVIGIPSASFITLLGSAGVAIGLALQGALGNLAGGLMILFFKLFRVGDYIETTAGSGTVKSINVFYTVLTTPDNRQLNVPNSTLTNASITNYSVEKTRRIDFTFDVAYASDSDQVKEALISVAKADPRILFDPQPQAWMSAHKASAVEFTLRIWCESENYWPLSFGMREAVKKALDTAGIEIPFNQLDVHIAADAKNPQI